MLAACRGQVSLGCALYAKLSLVTVLTPLPENRPEIYKELGTWPALWTCLWGWREYCDKVKWSRKTLLSSPTTVGSTIPRARILHCRKRWTPEFTTFCLLTVGTMWPPKTFSYLPAVNLWTVSQNTPFLLKLLLSGCFITVAGRATNKLRRDFEHLASLSPRPRLSAPSGSLGTSKHLEPPSIYCCGTYLAQRVTFW